LLFNLLGGKMRTWVEIDKENLKYNVLKLKEIANNREVLGVVKANAYGLGSIEIAKILKEVGVKFFGVANLEEAIELQEAGIKDKILILGASFEDELIEQTITLLSDIDFGRFAPTTDHARHELYQRANELLHSLNDVIR